MWRHRPALVMPKRLRASQGWQVPVELELGDLAAVVPPFLALVAQEEVEHVLAQRLGDKLAALHDVAGIRQTLRQRLHAARAPLRPGPRPDVLLWPPPPFRVLLRAPPRSRHDGC